MYQVLGLHQFDCARANKSTAAWGVEARVPFLDFDFIDEVMMTNPEDKLIKPVSGRSRQSSMKYFHHPQVLD